MFVRVKKVGTYQYLQIAQNRREGKRVKQSIIATLGRLDKLTESGAIDQLLRSAARFAERLILRDVNALSETTIPYNEKSFVVRSNAVGVTGKIAQCVGVRLPNTVRQIDLQTGRAEPSD